MPADRPPHRFLVPVDHEDIASEAIDVAARLARAINGTVTLLAAVPLPVPPVSPDGLGTTPATMTETQTQRTLERLARDRVDEAAAEIYASDGLDVRTTVTWGPEGPAIVEAVEEGNYDLVVLPMRREGPLGHLLHDQLVRHVLHHTAVPVLVVPVAEPGSIH